MSWNLRYLTFVVAALSACSITPRQTVLPYPEHIRVGIEAGDNVEIVTRDGRHIVMVVARLTNEEIVGRETTVAFDAIETLEKRDWKPVRNPCDQGEAFGCSIPRAVTLLSEFHDEYRARFDASCRQHDFCYRFGFQTYGIERTECDADFLQRMRDQCRGTLQIDPIELAECMAAAQHLHDTVVRFGEKAFRRETGTYCEYAGPPSAFHAR